MTDRTSTRLPRVALIALACVLAIVGWLAGIVTRSSPDVRAPAQRAAVAPSRTPLPQLASAGASNEAVDALHPRPAREWQGMLVDVSQRQYCEASSYCGLALACLDDRKCGPCQRDDQCASGEACVLDHCVASASAACRTRADCAPDELCVLSGLSGGDPRGNTGMRAFCRPSSGGRPQDESAPDARRAARLAEAAAQQPVAPPVSPRDLRARLDAVSE